MTTSDANGILYLQTSDPVAPLEGTINALQLATSNAFNTLVTPLRNEFDSRKPFIPQVFASEAARNAAVTSPQLGQITTISGGTYVYHQTYNGPTIGWTDFVVNTKIPRMDYLDISNVAVAAGATLRTFTISARNYETRVIVDLAGQVSPNGSPGATTLGINMTGTFTGGTGTLSQAPRAGVKGNQNYWDTVVYQSAITLPPGVGFNGTFIAASSGGNTEAVYRARAHFDRRPTFAAAQ